MKLSAHFHLSEFTGSQAASRLGLSNDPGPAEIAALRLLCVKVLEPVRAHFAAPLVIGSGYRAPAVNRAIGGAKASQHTRGEAADFEIPGVDNVTVARWMQARIAYDQLILEFHTPGDPHSGWIHVSYREPLRNEELTARRVRRFGRLRTEYVQGIVA